MRVGIPLETGTAPDLGAFGGLQGSLKTPEG